MTTVPSSTPIDPPSTTPQTDPQRVVQTPGDPTPQPLDRPIDTEPKGGKVQGEGDYEAGRRYNEATRDYVNSHDVEQAAVDAEPDSSEEAEELERAEDEGRSRSRGEDAKS